MGAISNHKNDRINYGKVIYVRGSVVDVWFEANLPSIFFLLQAGEKKEIAIEVLGKLKAQREKKRSIWFGYEYFGWWVGLW